MSKNRFVFDDMDHLWAEQIAFWRDHLDIAIEEMFAPVKLKDQQRVIARAFGRSNT